MFSTDASCKVRCSGTNRSLDGRCENCQRAALGRCIFTPVTDETQELLAAKAVWPNRDPPTDVQLFGAYGEPIHSDRPHVCTSTPKIQQYAVLSRTCPAASTLPSTSPRRNTSLKRLNLDAYLPSIHPLCGSMNARKQRVKGPKLAPVYWAPQS